MMNWKDRLIITISIVAIPIGLFIFTSNIYSRLFAVIAFLIWLEALRTAYKGYKNEKKTL